MDPIVVKLQEAGLPCWETSFTALDAYLRLPRSGPTFLFVAADLQSMARALEDLHYPGLPYADGLVHTGESRTLLTCAEQPHLAERHAFDRLDIFRKPGAHTYLDPHDVWPEFRSPTLVPGPAPPERFLFEAAALVSRYRCELPDDSVPGCPVDVTVEWQRDILELILTGSTPERGLELLHASGFIDRYWPELASLAGVEHAKDHHPEGDGWNHTIETLRHRKNPELSLSLALLLHDTGKPDATSSSGRRFDRHAEIGAGVARRFLLRLGFGSSLVENVVWLVRNHMLPAALPSLPLHRVDGVIDDPRFPLLLELYRCDEFSSFRGPDGYYRSCAAYRIYLRNVRNPYRDARGRILAGARSGS